MRAAQRLALAGALVLPACGAGTPGGQSVEVTRRWSVPAMDVGPRCDDLSDTRICWDSHGEATRVAREVPPFAPPTPLGFRCSGQGAERTCEPRDGAGVFACDGAICTQRHPRQPDDGEWECADDSGVTVCAGGEPPSGVATAKPVPGWTCGSRARGDDTSSLHGARSSRVCVESFAGLSWRQRKRPVVPVVLRARGHEDVHARRGRARRGRPLRREPPLRRGRTLRRRPVCASPAGPRVLARRRLRRGSLPLRLLRRGRPMRFPVDARRWAPVLAILVACARDARDRPVAWLVIETAQIDPEALDALDALRVSPPGAFVRAVRSGPRVVVGIDVRDAASGVRVDVLGACPVRLASADLVAGATVRRMLASRIELGLPVHPRDLGYGARFAVDASLGCEAAGSLAWRQVSGPPLRDVHADGAHFEATTAPQDGADVTSRPSWGIVPVSARGSDEIVIEATLRPTSGGEAAARKRVTLAAASQSRGLPNVAVDDGLLLSGMGWSLQSVPKGATESLRAAGDLTRIVPDLAGTWTLRDANGHTLSIHAGCYDETPLDCGRATCHGTIASAARRSPMTEAFEHLALAARPCAVACHATGEPGVHDGGFAALARELGVSVGETDWDELPRAMRRVGGVTCLGCHGPGAIPEASARWAILRADVCATCHDAPPTYGHVSAWRASRMARADADPRTRSSGACPTCHTTSGFLASLQGKPDSRKVPPDMQGAGIACAACHAPHAEHGGAAPADALVREVRSPAWLEGVSLAGGSSVCVPCHSPPTTDTRLAPAASSAALWAGRGGVDPATGQPLAAPAIHGGVSCTGCHEDGPAALDRGRGHAFQAHSDACPRCHEGAMPDVAAGGRMRSEAAALLARLADLGALRAGTASGSDPSHVVETGLANDRLGRAAYDVLLVLEDPGAMAHNAPFARTLLAAAERAIVDAGGTR